MFAPTFARRAVLLPHRIIKPLRASVRSSKRHYAQSAPPPNNNNRQAIQILAALLGGSAAYGGWRLFSHLYLQKEEEPVPQGPSEAEVVFEKPRKEAKSKEENRDIISSQHLQVKKSWENPGLYAWGSNSGRVVAPDSDDKIVKTPQRLSFFDGILLRDVKLDRNFGAAIDDRGDLLQWGIGYSAHCKKPEKTLRGKNLKSLVISRDRIIALSNNGAVYSLPISQDEQRNGPKPTESTWIPFWSSASSISYRQLQPTNLSLGERVSKIAGGLEHVLLLTSTGRLFSAAAASQDFPRQGQLGVPGLTWLTCPPGAFDQCHEITTLKGFDISSIAAGDFHSVVADKDGRVFTFGDNSYGQLGLEFNPESSIVDAPCLIPLQKLYSNSSQVPKVTAVAAGGNNTYFTVDATRVASPNDEDDRTLQRLGLVTADTWACGQGIWGSLGNGRWTHVQSTPVKIPALSGLFEYDEVKHRTIPIRLSRLSVGQSHAAAVMDNVTYLDANHRSGENDTNWGADILFFGNNEYYQLGTGKRNNVSTPTYIQPLDQVAENAVRGKGSVHRFQITPMKHIKLNGRWVSMEQRIECGRGCTAVYSGV